MENNLKLSYSVNNNLTTMANSLNISKKDVIDRALRLYFAALNSEKVILVDEYNSENIIFVK